MLKTNKMGKFVKRPSSSSSYLCLFLLSLENLLFFFVCSLLKKYSSTDFQALSNIFSFTLDECFNIWHTTYCVCDFMMSLLFTHETTTTMMMREREGVKDDFLSYRFRQLVPNGSSIYTSNKAKCVCKKDEKVALLFYLLKHRITCYSMDIFL